MRIANRFGLAVLGVWCGFPLHDASAFPENIRHGYINCNSCHVNPNGQGLLNAYGRELSVALQSYGKFFFEPAKKEGQSGEAHGESSGDEPDQEGQFLYGYFAHPKWLLL